MQLQFSFHPQVSTPRLHSFPTRRSSDLDREVRPPATLQRLCRRPRLRPAWARIQPPKVIGMESMELMDILWPTIAKLSRALPRSRFRIRRTGLGPRALRM